MRIPGVAASAVIELHEANAAFRETARSQAYLAKRLGDFLIEPVEALGFLALFFEGHRLGNRHLHAISQLIRLDPAL